jgi:hypothetical protein
MDPNQIRFRTGEQIVFTATRNFALGNTGATISKGSEVLFDGSTVEFAGQTFSFPQLRGAIKLDWVVMAEHYDENDPNYGRPERANIQVRHATKGGNPLAPQPKMTISTTESDEREVMSVKGHAEQTRSANKTYVRGNPVNVARPGETVFTRNGFEVVEAQDGVEVPGRTFATNDLTGEKARGVRTDLTAEAAARALRVAHTVQVQPGQGITMEERLAQMSEGEREVYLAERAADREATIAAMPPEQQAAERAAQVIRERKIVGSVRKAAPQQTEGMLITPDVGHGVEIADPVGMGSGKPKEDVIFEDGIKFTRTNGSARHMQEAQNRATQAPQQAAAPIRSSLPEAPAEVRKMIAKAVCADFPDDYNFALPVKKRMARLQADYENRSDVIKAVFAAEGDEMKGLLMQEFPQAFQQ